MCFISAQNSVKADRQRMAEQLTSKTTLLESMFQAIFVAFACADVPMCPQLWHFCTKSWGVEGALWNALDMRQDLDGLCGAKLAECQTQRQGCLAQIWEDPTSRPRASTGACGSRDMPAQQCLPEMEEGCEGEHEAAPLLE